MGDKPSDLDVFSGAMPPYHDVTLNGSDYQAIKEGLAYILTPRSALAAKTAKDVSEVDPESQKVFYNPIQQFNRDLSVLAIRAYGEAVLEEKRRKRERNLRDKVGKAGRGKKRKRVDTDGVSVTTGSDQIAESEEPTGGQSNEEGSVVRPQDESVEKQFMDPIVKKAKTSAAEGTEGSIQESLDQPRVLISSADVDDNHITNCTVEPSTTKGSLSTQADHPISKSTEALDARSTVNPWKPTFTILDALSATGLRALRYAKEISFVTSITANDLSDEATASIKVNIQHNQLEDRVFAIKSDARAHMYNVTSQQSPKQPGGHVGKYDVIDLDPYGTAAPFLDAAVQAVNDGGLLCVTCTDSGVFASVGYLEKTYALYGGLPWKGQQSHEIGLRLIINAIASSAARYGISIEPLLSLSIDFYARIFVRVRRSPAEVKYLAGKTMIVYNCDSGCGAWTTQLLARNKEVTSKKGNLLYKHTLAQGPSTTELCEHCGLKTHMAGPMWAGPLHNNSFIQRILDLLPHLDEQTYATIPRLEGMLSVALGENISTPLPSDSPSQPAAQEMSQSFTPNNPVEIDHHPFFFIPSTLAKVIHCQTPSEDELRGALRHLGYRVTRSHAKPGSIRTNAPWSVIWEVMREWARQKSPIKESAIKKGTAGWAIMQKSREHVRANRLKDEIKAALDQGGDVEDLRVQVEAALYRASTADLTNGDELAGAGSAENAVSAKAGVVDLTHGSARLSTDVSQLKVFFDAKLGRKVEKKKLVRYQLNPRPNWGPMNRAKGA